MVGVISIKVVFLGPAKDFTIEESAPLELADKAQLSIFGASWVSDIRGWRR